VTFTTDGAGHSIPPALVLLAAPDLIVKGTVQIFSRDDATETWAMNLGRAEKYSTTRAH
jgi:hypothetical protein